MSLISISALIFCWRQNWLLDIFTKVCSCVVSWYYFLYVLFQTPTFQNSSIGMMLWVTLFSKLIIACSTWRKNTFAVCQTWAFCRAGQWQLITLTTLTLINNHYMLFKYSKIVFKNYKVDRVPICFIEYLWLEMIRTSL